jgi:hypothetical protein
LLGYDAPDSALDQLLAVPRIDDLVSCLRNI